VRVLLLVLGLMLVVEPVLARGGNNQMPCDRNAGGVSHCVNGKFVCRNGKISRSKLRCDSDVENKAAIRGR
jgi:hypothetical protein